MNNLQFTTISTVIENWKQIAPNEINFNEELLTEWVIDAYYDIGTFKQFKEKIKELEVKDFKVQLPCGFKESLFVLAKPNFNSREQFFLTELVKQDFNDPNCTWTYKKTCKCNGSCVCDNSYLETNGWLYIENLEKAKALNFATVRDFTPWFTENKKEWVILQPKTSDFSLLRHVNKKFERDFKPQNVFTIDNNYLITDFKEARVLIGYLSIPLDENNLPLIPNTKNYISALIAAIEEKLAYVQYRKSKNNMDLNFFQVAQKEYIKYKLKAREDVNTQTFDEMWAMGEAINQFLVPNSYHGLDQRKSQKINNGFTRY